MSQNNDTPKKAAPTDAPASEAKRGGGWRDPARRRGFNLGVRGKYPASPPPKS